MTHDLPSRDDIELALGRLAGMADDQVDIAETALLLAALERPRVALDRYRLHLRDLADGVARRASRHDGGRGLYAAAEALLAVISEEHGYRGDDLTYDDLQNANLMRVIDRRKGLPVALGILYIHAARAQGWSACGLNFPAHFLIAVERDGERAILDPFRARRLDGAEALRGLLKTVLGADAELDPGHCAELTNRGVLLRLQNNLKTRLAAQGRVERAVAVIERMLLFAPTEAGLWMDAGTLYAHEGNLRAALAAFERYRDLMPDGAAKMHAAQTIQLLRRQMH